MTRDAPAYRFAFNGVVMSVTLPRLTVGQIRALTATSPDYDLILEGSGSAGDRPLREDEIVDLASGGIAIFTRGLTQFGRLQFCRE